MTPTTIGLLMFAGMLLMMALRVPIAAAMFIPGALGYWALTSDMALIMTLSAMRRWPMMPTPPPIVQYRPILVLPAIALQPQMMVCSPTMQLCAICT